MSMHSLRPAEPRDADAVVGLIGELAEFEQLTRLLEVTPATLERARIKTPSVSTSAWVLPCCPTGAFAASAAIGWRRSVSATKEWREGT